MINKDDVEELLSSKSDGIFKTSRKSNIRI